MTNQTNLKKDEVTCTFNNGKRAYQVTENGKVSRSLSISDKGLVRLTEGEKTVAELRVYREENKTVNIGGEEQYISVTKPIDVDSIEGLMGVYQKISNQKFYTYDKRATAENGKLLIDEEKEKVGKLMTSFLDNYVFNDKESRTVLNEYLNGPTKEDADKRKKSNELYLETLNNRVHDK